MANTIDIIDDDTENEEEGSRKWPFFWWSILTALVLLLLWPHVIIKVDPGFVGVLYRRFFGGTELEYIFKEGTHSVFPWDTMYLFDTKIQENTYEFNVLNKSGLIVSLEITIMYQPIATQTPVLLTNVGTDYKEKLIKPMLRATVVDVIARHITEELFNETISIIRDEMLVGMITNIGRLPVKVHSILIRNVKLPSDLNKAINDKLVAQQRVYEKRYLVQQAVEDYKRAFVEASSVRMAQEIVNPLMTESFLTFQGIEATKQVANSTNSKVVIIGNKEGLPLILNLDRDQVEGGSAPTTITSEAINSENATDTTRVTPRPTPNPAATPLSDGEARSFLERVAPEKLENLITPLGEALGLTGPKQSGADLEKVEENIP
jgi:regulator of protease activity HflC (stomatin/prohibitin superfamily)